MRLQILSRFDFDKLKFIAISCRASVSASMRLVGPLRAILITLPTYVSETLAAAFANGRIASTASDAVESCESQPANFVFADPKAAASFPRIERASNSRHFL